MESYDTWPLVPASITGLPFSGLTRVVAHAGTSFPLAWMWLGFGNATQIRHRTLKLTLFEHEPGEASRSFWELIGQLDRRKWSLEAEMSMEALLGFLQEAMRLRSGSRRRGRSEQDIDEDPSAGPSGVPLRGLGQSNVWLRLRREREGSTFSRPLGVMAAAVFSWLLSREGTRALPCSLRELP